MLRPIDGGGSVRVDDVGGEPIVLRPGWSRAWSMFVPPMFLVLVVPLGVAAAARAGEWGAATGLVMLGLVSGVIGWRRFLVRLVADAGEVLILSSCDSRSPTTRHNHKAADLCALIHVIGG